MLAIAPAAISTPPRDGADLARRLIALGRGSLIRAAVWWLAEHTPPGLAFEDMGPDDAAACWAALQEQSPWLARQVAADAADGWPF